MEHRRHTLPPGYSLHQLPLDNPSGLSRARQPLADSAGNAQHHTLASVLYHDSKGHQARVERPMYSIPTVPSQPPRQSVGNTLELRRQSTRRQRNLRFSRNPIIESSQYQAYRARQNREGTGEDAKWPEDLEMAFLDGKTPLIAAHLHGSHCYSIDEYPSHGPEEVFVQGKAPWSQ